MLTHQILTHSLILLKIYLICLIDGEIFGSPADLMVKIRELYKSTDVILIYDESEPGWQDKGIKAVKKFSQMNIISQSVSRAQLVKSYDKLSQSEHVTRPLMSIEINGPKDIEFLSTIMNPKNNWFHTWLLVARGIGCKPPIGNPLKLGIYSQLIVYCVNGSSLKRYNSFDGTKTDVSLIGTWTIKDGLNIFDYSRLYVIKNLKGLGVTGAKPAPRKIQNDFDIVRSGFIETLFRELKNITNFTIGTKVQLQTNNGTVIDSFLETIETKNIDLFYFATAVTQKRKMLVDFSIPIAEGRYRIIVKLPDEPKIHWNTYYRIFSVDEWFFLLLIAFSGVTILLIIRLVLRIRRRLSYRSVIDCFIDIWYILCMRSLPDLEISSRLSIKIFNVVLLLSALMINYIYSATITSYITVLLPKLSFNNYFEFFNNTNYKITTLPYSATDYFLDKEFWLHDFVKPRLEDYNSLSSNVFEAIERVCKEDLAFIVNYFYYNSIGTKQPSCLLDYVKLPLIERIAIVFPKDSPYINIINYNILRLYDSGIIKRLKNFYYYERINKPKNKPLNLSFADFSPIFIIWAIGVIASLVILYIELAFYYFQLCRKRHRVSRPVRKIQ